jgi:hypothetical protein
MRQLPVFVPSGIGILKRPVIFIVLGPLLGLCGAVLAEVIAGKGVCLSCDLEGPVLAIFFSFWVSLLTCPVDAVLSRFVPAIARVPLIAICGAAIAAGLLMSLVGGKYIPLAQMQPILTIAAICMGLCALLSSGRNSE